MKNPTLRLFVGSVTLVENGATAVALFGYLWICLLPYHISAAQDRALDVVYAAVALSLIVAWVCAVLSLGGLWYATTGRSRGAREDRIRNWVLASAAAALAITAAHLSTSHFSSVGR